MPVYDNINTKTEISSKYNNVLQDLSDGLFVGDSDLLYIKGLTNGFPIGTVLGYNSENGTYEAATDASGTVLGIFLGMTSDGVYGKVLTHGQYDSDQYKAIKVWNPIYTTDTANSVTDEETGHSFQIGIRTPTGILLDIKEIRIKNLSRYQIDLLIQNCFPE